MSHNFIDSFISREKQFSVGKDSISGCYYVSFLQVTENRRSEYEVYFEVPSRLIHLAKNDPIQLEQYVHECRRGEHFELKIS